MTRETARKGRPLPATGFWASGSSSLARWLHPGAWWLWAIGLAIAASRTTNPLLLIGIVLTCLVVVQARKPQAPWARSFHYFLILGAVIVVVRVVFQIVLGTAIGTTLLLDLPGAVLPTWMAGIRLGGPVYLESLLAGLYDGMRLATLVICVGAANSLASPTRLLKAVPAALYEVGVAVVVAISFTPRLIQSIIGIRATRRLRGRSTKGVRAVASSAVPVLHSALEDSVVLAAAMDSRGYGRRSNVPRRTRRLASIAILVGLLTLVVATYGLLAPGTPIAMSAGLVAVGLVGSIVGMNLAGKANARTVYRPDPWWLPEWWTMAVGMLVAIAFIITDFTAPAAMETSTMPPAVPALPLACVIGLALALTPAIVAPEPPLRSTKRTRETVNA